MDLGMPGQMWSGQYSFDVSFAWVSKCYKLDWRFLLARNSKYRHSVSGIASKQVTFTLYPSTHLQAFNI